MKEFLDNFGVEIDAFKLRSEYYEIVPGMEKFDGRIISLGLPLGVQRKKFEPSLYLLEKLSKMSDNKVFVTDEAEWLFLCGRDVFDKNIFEDNTTGRLFLVQNLRNENLGLGIMKGNMVKNIIDRGDFLRRER